ncbi:aldehyde dehydrogenase family 16 member A1-like, partial [Sinocyclocheilus grahami]|uniref:aldehyde dehydrogenase family 16 member A1-like n=1 Tax=Sinocyclocheilus grahami TaxID=75366 RepID=UPI0007AC5D7C
MKKSPTARSQSLYSLADSLDNRRQDLAVSIQTQTGISLEEAEKEVELSVSRLTDWAARCDKEQGGTPFPPQSGSALSTPEALGVLGVILPNSKPLLSLVSLLGPAVAMGNAVIMVPSEKYPLPALEFIQVLQASDIPGGLVSIITGGRDQLTAVSFFNTPVSVPLNVCGYTVKRRRRGKRDETGPAQIPLFKKSFGGRRWSGK